MGTVCAIWCPTPNIQTFAVAGKDKINVHNLSGVVVNAVTGAPISRALVKISPRYGSVLTGPDGNFFFHGIPEGPLTILVTKPGFFQAARLLSQSPPMTLELHSPNVFKPYLQQAQSLDIQPNAKQNVLIGVQ